MQFSTCKILDLTKAAGARGEFVTRPGSSSVELTLALIFTHDSGI